MVAAVVLDTMVASAWLDRAPSPVRIRWAPSIQDAPWLLPITVVAEIHYGAELARWGPARRAALMHLIARSRIGPIRRDVIDAYVQLRTWCVRTGHGLGRIHP